MSTVRMVPIADDVALGVQALGATDGPPLLLMGGGACSMDWWDDDLCDRLAGRGWRVIRFDYRDTGASTSWPTGAPGYTGHDLLHDVLAVLDDAGAARAHLVGLSMGGGLAQRVALEHPDRVRAVTLMATTPIDPAVGELPGMSPELEAFFTANPPEPVPTGDEDGAVTALVEGERPFAGPGAFDEVRIRGIAERVVRRTRDLAAGNNHFVLEDGPAGPTDLGRLAGLPALVVHGDADPVFPLPHGAALAAAIPGARLLTLADVGHQYPPEPTWDAVVDALAEIDPAVTT